MAMTRFVWRKQLEYLPNSLRLDVGRADHLGPLVSFVGDELFERSGRAHKHRSTEVSKPRVHFWVGEARVNLPVKPIDDISRCVLRSADTLPTACLVARHKFAYCGNIRQHLQP